MSGRASPPRKSILEAERSRKMVELLLNKGCKTDLSGVCLARLDLSSLHMPSIALIGSDLRSPAPLRYHLHKCNACGDASHL